MSVKRIILASLLFLLVFVISVVAHFPASVAYRLLPPLQGVQLSGISGTVWDGQVASVSVSNNQVGKLSLGKVNWQVDFTRLFKGAGALDIRFGQGSSIGLSGRGTVGYGLDGLFAERLMVSLPADKVGPYIPSMVPLSLKGKVDLTVREFQAGQPLCRVLDGNLVWNDSEVIVPVGEVALGQVFGKLGCTGGEITVAADQKSDAWRVKRT